MLNLIGLKTFKSFGRKQCAQTHRFTQKRRDRSLFSVNEFVDEIPKHPFGESLYFLFATYNVVQI